MPRGRLKIFFGAFPGAGKTAAMLNAARRVKDAGRDVVIGFLDLHGKNEDAPLAEGFEQLPGSDTGLSLDAALARTPEVIVVDDLAHSNPPGRRHPKRWNDVDELLGNGIDVFTSMSVQHLESLNDVVAEITGISEAETVPDTFFDCAEETIMVDMSADELLARRNAGEVPLGHVKHAAGSRFFDKGSLLALREIALRRVADVVEDEVVRYRSDKAIKSTWKTHGRMLVCIGPAAGSEHTVRSAARLAGQLDEEWTAVYVETPRLQRLPADQRSRILQVVSLAQELGAKTAILTGNSVSEAVAEYARDHNISTIVVGRTRSRDFVFQPATSDLIARRGDNFDIVEIGQGDEHGTPVVAPRLQQPGDVRRGEKRMRYFWTVAASIGATAILSAFERRLDLANEAMVYMLVVVVVGVLWGRGPAILAAFLNVVALDFFFVPPRFSLGASDLHHYLTFGVMLAVGVITGHLAGGMRYQARVATHRENRARTLYEFARDLAQLGTTSGVIDFVEDFMQRQFRARVSVLVPDVTGLLVSPTAHGMTNPFDSTTAQWTFDQSKQAGAGTDTLAGSEYVFLPLKSTTRTWGVLAVRPERARDLMIPELRHQFEIFSALVATALERVHYLDVAQDALLMARMQSGEYQLALERKPLREIVDAALASLGAILGKHPVTVEVPPGLPLVNVDPKLMERVFTSLAGNVAKHTPAGTQLRIEARVASGELEIAVSDNGPGLPQGREEELFGSFERGGSAPPRRGAGLGLAITRSIVTAHGGTIHAERPVEGGARIVIRLPLGTPRAAVRSIAA